MLRESEHLMLKAGARLPFERLEEVVTLWKEMDWVSAAVQLPLKCAAEWDPHGFARSYREDGLPQGDLQRRGAYDVAMRCYGLVLTTLRDLDDKVDAARQGDASSAAISRLESYRSLAYHLAQQYKDPSKVTIIDRDDSPPKPAAAIDINRVIRTDYAKPMYSNLAYEAWHAWFWSLELQPYFHQVGWIMMDKLLTSSSLSAWLSEKVSASTSMTIVETRTD